MRNSRRTVCLTRPRQVTLATAAFTRAEQSDNSAWTGYGYVAVNTTVNSRPTQGTLTLMYRPIFSSDQSINPNISVTFTPLFEEEQFSQSTTIMLTTSQRNYAQIDTFMIIQTSHHIKLNQQIHAI